jgi:amino acid transporter
MDTIVKVIGIVIILLAVLLLLKPDIMKHILKFFKYGKRIYLAGLVRLILAVVFLLAASECDIPWVIVLFGILFLISAMVIFMLGAEKLSPMLDWFQNKSPLFLRFMAVIIMAVGALIIYSA